MKSLMAILSIYTLFISQAFAAPTWNYQKEFPKLVMNGTAKILKNKNTLGFLNEKLKDAPEYLTRFYSKLQSDPDTLKLIKGFKFDRFFKDYNFSIKAENQIVSIGFEDLISKGFLTVNNNPYRLKTLESEKEFKKLVQELKKIGNKTSFNPIDLLINQAHANPVALIVVVVVVIILGIAYYMKTSFEEAQCIGSTENPNPKTKDLLALSLCCEEVTSSIGIFDIVSDDTNLFTKTQRNACKPFGNSYTKLSDFFKDKFCSKLNDTYSKDLSWTTGSYYADTLKGKQELDCSSYYDKYYKRAANCFWWAKDDVGIEGAPNCIKPRSDNSSSGGHGTGSAKGR